MSARSQTTGPSPFLIADATPVLPSPSTTSSPRTPSSRAMTPAVRVSWNESSGWRCRSMYRASRSMLTLRL